MDGGEGEREEKEMILPEDGMRGREGERDKWRDREGA